LESSFLSEIIPDENTVKFVNGLEKPAKHLLDKLW